MGVSVEDDEMCCQAGVDLREASEMACELGLSGLEFACGIPGSVGGRLLHERRRYDGCMADVLKEVRVLTPAGDVCDLGVDELDLGYRHSRIADEGLVGALRHLCPLPRGRREDPSEDGRPHPPPRGEAAA